MRAAFVIVCFLMGLDGQEMKSTSISDSEWSMTRLFMSLFNAKDLVIYYTSMSYPDNDLVSKIYKEMSSSKIQTAFVTLPNEFNIPDHYFGSEVPSVKLFLLDNETSSDMSVLAELSMSEIWTSVNVWLIRMSFEVSTKRQIATMMEPLKLDYKSQVYTFSESPNGDLLIHEVYKIFPQSDIVQILEYGSWSSEEGLDVNDAHIWHRRANLQGLKFRAASLYNKPYVTMVSSSCTKKECFQGMFADAFHELQRIMNFTYEVNLPDDDEWGRKKEDGTWTGIIGQLIEGTVDIAPVDLRITSLRGPVVDFLPPLDEPHMRLFIANPAESFNWYAYVNPYTTVAWILIAMAVFGFALVFTFIIGKGKPEPKKDDFTLLQSLSFVAGTVTIRDWLSHPSTGRSRVAFISLVSWGTMVYYHWEAMIISYLAVRNIALPFNSMEELVYDTDFKIVLHAGTSYIDTFRYGNTPVLKKAWEERIKPYVEDFPLTKEGMSRWIHEDKSFAMLDNYNVRIYHEDYINCETVDIPKVYFPMQFAMAMAKDSQYFEAFWHHTNTLKERGALMQIKERYQNEAQKCPDYSGKPLGFGQTFTAFLVLIGGLVFAMMLMGLEFVHHLSNCQPAADFKGSKLRGLLVEMNDCEEEIRILERRQRQIKKIVSKFRYNNG